MIRKPTLKSREVKESIVILEVECEEFIHIVAKIETKISVKQVKRYKGENSTHTNRSARRRDGRTLIFRPRKLSESQVG